MGPVCTWSVLDQNIAMERGAAESWAPGLVAIQWKSSDQSSLLGTSQSTVLSPLYLFMNGLMVMDNKAYFGGEKP